MTVRVDLRAVERSLRQTGHYDSPLGARIVRGGLRAVYLRGDPAPLTWDTGALHPGSLLELKDRDGDGIYEGTVPIATEYAWPRTADGRALWARHLDLGGYPELTSSQRFQDAIYRLSLEELQQLIRDDGALSAGAKWGGVWTRDVSLSVILSLALVAPDATRRSLLAKVDSSGRIIQDTNAIHYAAYRVLGDMARALGEPSARWDSTAAGIQRGMTTYSLAAVARLVRPVPLWSQSPRPLAARRRPRRGACNDLRRRVAGATSGADPQRTGRRRRHADVLAVHCRRALLS